MHFLKKITASVAVLAVSLSVGILSVFAFEPTVGTVTSSALNVRSAPSTSADILATVTEGSKFLLVDKVENWYKVNIGMDGYVSAEYVMTDAQLVAAQAAAVEVQPAAPSTSKGEQVVEVAKRYIGTRYVYGGSTPSGFDCSGYVKYVYAQMGINLNRVAADQTQHGVYVSKENLQPGDLVFFAKPGRAIHHVGIYVGNGQYIHSPQTGRTVSIEAMTRADYYTARRIF